MREGVLRSARGDHAGMLGIVRVLSTRLIKRRAARVLDFRGVPTKAFDGPLELCPSAFAQRAADLTGDRLRQDRTGPRHGHQYRHDGATDEDAKVLLTHLGSRSGRSSRFVGQDPLIISLSGNRSRREPFPVCKLCGRPAATRSSRVCRLCFRELACSMGEGSGHR